MGKIPSWWEKLKSTRFYSNGCIKPGTFCINEERGVILLKNEFIWSKGYSISMWFNIDKSWINNKWQRIMLKKHNGTDKTEFYMNVFFFRYGLIISR